MAEGSNVQFSEREALDYHSVGRPGKIEIIASKPMATQRDLSLAYSPGVAVPVLAIAEDPNKAYDYTAKGNLVAVISNGTAILGLGNLGALASKPVMEGKAVLFKRFADVDSIDLELDTEDVEQFVNAVALLEPSFGGINLEDIKAPECFVIEQALRERMNIPVFHDDQHGTAIITAAGLINACYLTGRELKDINVVVNGAGAAAIACTELIKAMGVSADKVIMCDRKGVIYQGRTDQDGPVEVGACGQDRSAHADGGARRRRRVPRPVGEGRAEARNGDEDGAAADHLRHGEPGPGNHAARGEGRASRRDHRDRPLGLSEPGQQRARLPLHLPRRARCARHGDQRGNENRRRAGARQPRAPAGAGGSGRRLWWRRAHFGPDYIIPAPFDPRLMEIVPAAVAAAAMRTGVARRPIEDMVAYRETLNCAASTRPRRVLTMAHDAARANPKRVVFAEAEEEVVLRAAIAFRDGGYGTPVLVGRDDVPERLRALGIDNPESFELHNSRHSPLVPKMVDYLYARLQRRGYLRREVESMVNQDRNIFGALLLALGEADAMITGVTRTYARTLRQIRRVLDPVEGRRPLGIHVIVGKHTVFMADTMVSERPDPRNSPRSPSILPPSRAAWATSRASPSCPSPPSATRRARGSTMSARRWAFSTASRSISNMKARWRPTSRWMRR
jgi:malate dehydrogenase (oxaloacetate-decarboxylating)(NADP+)